MSSLDMPTSSKKHFSFIVERNKIISYGWNNGYRTCPISARYGHRFSGIHSELAAIRNFPYPPVFLSQYRIVNLRVLSAGTLGLSKPCVYCQKMLFDFGISDIWYSTNTGEFINELGN